MPLRPNNHKRMRNRLKYEWKESPFVPEERAVPDVKAFPATPVTIVLLAVLLLAGCVTPRKTAIIEDKPLSSNSAEIAAAHDIYVITTRQRANDASVMFSGDRSSGLALARVTVTIPPNHTPGQITRPRRLPADPSKEFSLVAPTGYATEAGFLADLDTELQIRSQQDRSVLVFVHGFNSTYAEAVMRLGQFVHDSGFTGVPVLFSWASAGNALEYVYDLNSALSARNDLVQASGILLRSNASSVNVMAHSMGNLLTVEAMRQAQSAGIFNRSGKLKNIILASADIDMDVFRDQMSVFVPEDRRFYVLISADDKALATSRFLAKGVNRVGDANAEELAALGVTVIDMSAVRDPDSFNHGKFADAPEVVQLIGTAIEKGNAFDTSSTSARMLGGAVIGVAGATALILDNGG